MKKLFLLPLILIILAGCQDKETQAELEELKAQTALEEQNKALIEKYIDAWNARDFEVIQGLLDPQFRAYVPSNSQEPMTREQNKTWVEGIFQNFPDVHYDIQEILAEGDWVTVRWNCTASIAGGEAEGDEAGGDEQVRQLVTSAIEIYRVADGKILKEWSEANILGWNQQMGYTLVMQEE